MRARLRSGLSAVKNGRSISSPSFSIRSGDSPRTEKAKQKGATDSTEILWDILGYMRGGRWGLGWWFLVGFQFSDVGLETMQNYSYTKRIQGGVGSNFIKAPVVDTPAIEKKLGEKYAKKRQLLLLPSESVQLKFSMLSSYNIRSRTFQYVNHK